MTTEERRIATRRRDRGRTVAVWIAAACLVAMVWLMWLMVDGRQEAEQDRETLAQRVTAACNSGGAARAELDRIGACQQAREQVMAPILDQSDPDDPDPARDGWFERRDGNLYWCQCVEPPPNPPGGRPFYSCDIQPPK